MNAMMNCHSPKPYSIIAVICIQNSAVLDPFQTFTGINQKQIATSCVGGLVKGTVSREKLFT